MISGDPYYDEEYVEGIRSVTAEEIRAAATRYLVPERMSVAVIKPPATEPVAIQAVSDESCPVPKSEPVLFERMQNGLKVLMKKDQTLPFVTLHVFGTGGLMLEGLQRPGISAFTASLLTSGTKSRTKMELLKVVEDAGGIIGATSDNNTYHIAIKVLKEDFDWAVVLLADIVRNSSFPVEEIDKQRQDTLIAIKRSDESWQYEVMRLFKKNYFHNASYVNDRLGTAESVKSFTREDILDFYKKMVNPTHSAIAVFGDIDTEKAGAMIRDKFAQWSGTPVQKDLPDETAQIKENRKVEIKNEKNSAALFIGMNGMDVNNEERPVLDVLSSVLSGQGGRVFDALRGGDKDLVYTVHSIPFYGKKAGFFGIITQTTLGKLEEVQGIIMANLKRLANEPVPQNELDRAKESMLVGLKLGKETLDNQASSAALNEVLGLGWDYDKKYPELVRAVRAEQVQAMAKKLFGHTLIARTLPERPVEILASPPPMRHDVQM
jgi:zinc protease